MKCTKYWFGFRQTYPEPPGGIVVCGPFNSLEEAKTEREKTRQTICHFEPSFGEKSALNVVLIEQSDDKDEKHNTTFFCYKVFNILPYNY